MTPGEIAMAIAMGVLLIAGGYAIAYRAGRNREREREPSEAALFAGHADADAVDGERRMLAMLEEAVIVTDSSAKVLVANEAAIERGLSVDGLIVDAGIRDLVQEAAQSDAAVERELELARDSQRLHVAVTAQCTADDRVTVVCADTGYRRSVDRVRRDFVTNVSHELKTPVGAIMLLAETIDDAGDDVDMIRHFAARIGVEAKRLDGLVRRLIELGRMHGDRATTRRTVDARELVRQAIIDTEVTAGARHTMVRMRDDAGENHPLPVTVDAAAVHIALKNLVEKAINYSPEHAEVTVEVSRGEDQARIRVVDHGIGIPRQLQGRIFERFYRVDPARSRLTGGTGLGLSIASHHILANQGKLEVWSKPGEGSTFTVMLPLAMRDDDTPCNRDADAEGDPDGTGKEADR